eukprot:Ihof_evm2s454 gene=Ihof_evmTU2s454
MDDSNAVNGGTPLDSPKRPLAELEENTAKRICLETIKDDLGLDLSEEEEEGKDEAIAAILDDAPGIALDPVDSGIQSIPSLINIGPLPVSPTISCDQIGQLHPDLPIISSQLLDEILLNDTASLGVETNIPQHNDIDNQDICQLNSLIKPDADQTVEIKTEMNVSETTKIAVESRDATQKDREEDSSVHTKGTAEVEGDVKSENLEDKNIPLPTESDLLDLPLPVSTSPSLPLTPSPTLSSISPSNIGMDPVTTSLPQPTTDPNSQPTNQIKTEGEGDTLLEADVQLEMIKDTTTITSSTDIECKDECILPSQPPAQDIPTPSTDSPTRSQSPPQPLPTTTPLLQMEQNHVSSEVEGQSTVPSSQPSPVKQPSNDITAPSEPVSGGVVEPTTRPTTVDSTNTHNRAPVEVSETNESDDSDSSSDSDSDSEDEEDEAAEITNETDDNIAIPPSHDQPAFRVPERRTTNQLYYLENTLIKAIWKHKDSWPFQKPVDWQTLNIPDYPNIIKHPMDLGHIRKRLEGRTYKSAQEAIADIQLTFSNCHVYNPPGSDVVVMCERLEAMFARKLEKMPPVEKELSAEEEMQLWANLMAKREADRKLRIKKGGRSIKRKKRPADSGVKRTDSRPPSGPKTKKTKIEYIEPPSLPKRQSLPPVPLLSTLYDTPRQAKYGSKPGTASQSSRGNGHKPALGPRLKFCAQLLREMLSKKHAAYAYPFVEPVDPELHGCPDYYDVIKKPIDLSTIKQKMDNREYPTPNEFAEEIRLMFTNCYRYNSKDNEVFRMGRMLQDFFEVRYALLPNEDGPDLIYDGDEDLAGNPSNKKKNSKKTIKEMQREYQEKQREKEIMLKTKQEDRLKKMREKEKEKMLRQKQKEKERITKERRDKKEGKDRTKNIKDRNSGKGKLSSQSKRSSATTSKKASKKGAAPLPMNFAEKRALSNAINKLPPIKVPKILEIIQKHMELSQTPQEEIEIDIDSLSAAALRELEAYVILVHNSAKVKRAPARKPKSKSATSK